MQSLFRALADHAGIWIVILLLLVVALGVVCLRLSRALAQNQSRWRELLDGKRGEDLERILHDHLLDRNRLTGRVDQLEVRADTLERKMQRSKRHLGVVRYDAFPDVGGSQSFSMSIFDDNGDGVVVTSQVGREDVRVYAKPLVGGRSDRGLSQEETKALREAVEDQPRSILSQ